MEERLSVNQEEHQDSISSMRRNNAGMASPSKVSAALILEALHLQQHSAPEIPSSTTILPVDDREILIRNPSNVSPLPNPRSLPIEDNQDPKTMVSSTFTLPTIEIPSSSPSTVNQTSSSTSRNQRTILSSSSSLSGSLQQISELNLGGTLPSHLNSSKQTHRGSSNMPIG